MSEDIGGSAPATSSASPDTASTATSNDKAPPVTDGPELANKEAPKAADHKTIAAQIAELGDQDLDKMVTVKVNGESKKVPLRQALKWAQLGDSAYGKMQEAAKERQQMQQLFQLSKSNPREFFRVTGQNPREFAEKLLLEELEHDALTPEQKELKEHRAWRAEQERIAKEREEGAKQTAEQQEYQKLNSSMRNELVEAWKDSGLPEDPRFGSWIAATMIREKKLGNDLSMREAAGIVKADFIDHAKSVFGKLDPQALEQLIGGDMLKKWRDFDVKRVTDKGPQKSQSSTSRPPGSGASNKTKERKTMNEREWAEWYASR